MMSHLLGREKKVNLSANFRGNHSFIPREEVRGKELLALILQS